MVTSKVGRAHRSRAPTHEQDEDYEDDTLVHWQQVGFDYLDDIETWPLGSDEFVDGSWRR